MTTLLGWASPLRARGGHPRGYFLSPPAVVRSAPAEVTRSRSRPPPEPPRPLRSRGGHPQFGQCKPSTNWSAPRPRRSPAEDGLDVLVEAVRSAPAEVTRLPDPASAHGQLPLRARGGHPMSLLRAAARARRPGGPLRARGGHPYLGPIIRRHVGSAPRPRRSPAVILRAPRRDVVRSAPAEVTGHQLSSFGAVHVRSAPVEVTRPRRSPIRGARCPLRARGGHPPPEGGLRELHAVQPHSPTQRHVQVAHSGRGAVEWMPDRGVEAWRSPVSGTARSCGSRWPAPAVRLRRGPRLRRGDDDADRVRSARTEVAGAEHQATGRVGGGHRHRVGGSGRFRFRRRPSSKRCESGGRPEVIP